MPDPVVSSEADLLILVDEQDRELGHLDKASCHDGAGILHRAFSVFIFNDRGELLLQQRAAGKRLWPGYWSNSCCSHPRAGEELAEATGRRLVEELGISCEPHYLYTFIYHAVFGDEGAEHEVCSVYLGRCGEEEPRVNANEIADWRWIRPDELDAELARRPEGFTPWLRLEWPQVRESHREVLGFLE